MAMPTRREFLRYAAAGSPLLARAADATCSGLDGPIRWIVPNAPGGGYDTFSRLLEPYLEKALGLAIHVDNVDGAGGLRGAATLSEAAPDGSTLGIINLPGLLMAAMLESSPLNPLDDFALLGAIARSRHVWSTGASSKLTSAEQLLEIGRTRGLVFAMNAFTSLGFLSAAVPCALLGLRAEFVSGYGSSGQTGLAAIRGEVDLVSLSWDAQLAWLRSGDLRPLLRIADGGQAEHPTLEGIAALGGPQGVASTVSASAVEGAAALVRFTGAGRVAAAPRGMPPALERCLAESLYAALMEPDLKRKAATAQLPLEPAPASVTLSEARAVRSDVKRLEPIVREAIERAKA